MQGTPGFAVVADWLLNLPGSVYVSALVGTSLMCAITGNGSGGITTVYGLCDESVGKEYIHSFFTVTLGPLVASIVAVIFANLGVC